MAQHARDIILLMAIDGSIVYASESACDAYGYSPEQITALKITDLRASHTLRQVSEQMNEAAHSGVLFETDHVRSDGSVFPVEVSSRRVDMLGGSYLLSIVRDITNRREREHERDRLLKDLEAANRQLEGLFTIVSSAVGRVEIGRLLPDVLDALKEVMGADAALLLVSEGDRWRIVAQRGQESLEELTFPVGQGFASQVAMRNEPYWVADILATDYVRPFHKQFGARALVGVPLNHEGVMFGVLECVWTKPRDVSDGERVMLLVAAERIMSAVGAAQRYELSKRTGQLDAALVEASTLMSRSRRIETTMPSALEIAAQALGCDVALLGFSERAGCDLACALGLDPDDHDEAAVRRALSRAWSSVESQRSGASDAGEDLLEATGIAEALVVPVESDAERFGVIAFGSTDPEHQFDQQAREFARRFGRAVAVAHANARDYESEHQIAETLQEALLSIEPVVPGVSFGHLYRSATSSTRVGGDFYDIFPLPDGRVVILDGDVSGKGLDAAVLTTFIKHTIRAFAHAESSPSAIVARTNQVLCTAARLPDFASVVVLVVDPRTGDVTYCSAGHPPTLVVDGDGRVRPQECGSPVIGALPDLDFTEAHFTLGDNDTVVLYTDGVTEARDPEGGFFGDGRLQEVVGSCSLDDVTTVPERIYDRVMEYTGGRLSDDIAIVAFRIAGRS